MNSAYILSHGYADGRRTQTVNNESRVHLQYHAEHLRLLQHLWEYSDIPNRRGERLLIFGRIQQFHPTHTPDYLFLIFNQTRDVSWVENRLKIG